MSTRFASGTIAVVGAVLLFADPSVLSAAHHSTVVSGTATMAGDAAVIASE